MYEFKVLRCHGMNNEELRLVFKRLTSLLLSFTPGSKPTFSTNPSHHRFHLPAAAAAAAAATATATTTTTTNVMA